MEKLIAEAFGCQIIERDGVAKVQYDSGGIAVQFVEHPISAQQIDRFLSNESEAHKVILEIQKEHAG